MVRRVRSAALLSLCCGALALSPVQALAAPSIGPPPTLPDVGPPPMLPDVGPQNVPPTSAPTPPASPPNTGSSPPPATPTKPAGPPVMRPTIRPAPVPAPPPPSAPPANSPGTTPTQPADGPPPAAPEIGGVPAPGPPASPPGFSVSPPPGGDPALQAPAVEGADPGPAAPAGKDKKEPEKTLEEREEEEARARRKQPKRWRHAGLIVEPRFGTLGCTREFCVSTKGHHEKPGALLGGFVGGNLLGVLDVGIEAAWSTLRPGDLKGKNAVTLYSLDPARVEQALSERLGQEVDVDFNQLIVETASARTVSAGPALRLHFLRKGRGVAYIGTGIHYQLWRNRYETTGGPTRIDFHGFMAPFRIGGGAFVHPNIAITGEFAYHYAFYLITGVSHPEMSGFAPLTVIEGAALDAGANLRKGLPHFWSFSISVRFRLGL